MREEEVFELARKAVDEKQHARAEHLLRDARSDKAVFLRTYSRYIVRRPRWRLNNWILTRSRLARRKRCETGMRLTVRHLGVRGLEWN